MLFYFIFRSYSMSAHHCQMLVVSSFVRQAERNDDIRRDLGGCEDVEDLLSAMRATVPEVPFGCESPNGKLAKDLADIPEYDTSLHEVFQSCPDHSMGTVFDRLWRHLMYLRYWKGGGDRWWIKNPAQCRASTQGLNWYQCLGWNVEKPYPCDPLYDIVQQCFRLYIL